MSETTKIKLTIYGNPVTKKNSQRMVYAKGRIIPLPSKAYIDYEKSAKEQLLGQIGEPMIDYPVNVACTFYMGSRRRVDIGNLISGIHDILVSANVLADDNRDIVAGVDSCRVMYDKQNPRCEVTITEIENYEQGHKRESEKLPFEPDDEGE